MRPNLSTADNCSEPEEVLDVHEDDANYFSTHYNTSDAELEMEAENARKDLQLQEFESEEPVEGDKLFQNEKGNLENEHKNEDTNIAPDKKLAWWQDPCKARLRRRMGVSETLSKKEQNQLSRHFRSLVSIHAGVPLTQSWFHFKENGTADTIVQSMCGRYP